MDVGCEYDRGIVAELDKKCLRVINDAEAYMIEEQSPAFSTVFGSHSHVNHRTGLTHPLRVAMIPAGDGLGKIGVTFCPGKVQTDGATGSWNRDLATDIRAISDWGATTLVTLIEGHEIEALKVPHIEAECQRHGID